MQHQLPPRAPSASSTAATSAPAASDELSGHLVRSPMVGTRSIATQAQKQSISLKWVRSVKVGDALCIVEAMKMMNRIEADKAGVVKSQFLPDRYSCNAVEFDEPLIAIE